MAFSMFPFVVYYTPNLEGSMPSWALVWYHKFWRESAVDWLVRFGLAIFIYQTLDNIDGKQARATGTSSPLGQLFDHGCDSIVCTFATFGHLVALGYGPDLDAFLFMFFIYWNFYLPSWEEYYTGVFVFGFINGPCEGLLGGAVVCVLSGIIGKFQQSWQIFLPFLGTELFTQKMSQLIPPTSYIPLIGDLKANSFLARFAFGYIAILVVFHLLAVKKRFKQNIGGFLKASSGLVPMLMMFAASYGWVFSPFSAITSQYFLLFFTAFGMAFGKAGTKITYAHLTHLPFPNPSGLMIPLYVGCILANLPHFSLTARKIFTQYEGYYLMGWLVMSSGGYLIWFYHVIASFCHHLKIRPFTITPKPLHSDKTHWVNRFLTISHESYSILKTLLCL